MMKTFVAAKIHHISVTHAETNYIGSVTIDQNILQQAGIEPYEQVHIVNLTNGNRWETYALPGKPGVFSLNGGGALLGRVGDVCIIMTYKQEQTFSGATALILNSEYNTIRKTLQYPITTERPNDQPHLQP